ncbi:hypothetical protein OJAV_G00036320 [Oryzias javanicus]|uniref:AIG1-type G domain-containing protein n=1 Tax=Oryzias javanicus TaxID=123683 RepID=A0A437DG33_ORYJA|nr:hypothetical protein OJAV_G00036320 [Oryzias javanicus]
MATDGETTNQWKTTVIISSSIQNHESCRILSTQQHRIRFSDRITSGAFIFPLSGTAFLFVELQELAENSEELELMDRIKNFVEIHRNCFLLLFAPLNEPKELQTLKVIQNRFFGSNLKILTVRNYAEMVKGMLMIVKATSKPHMDSIRDRNASG